MNRVLVAVFLILGCTGASCDVPYTYQYQIVNTCDTAVSVRYKKGIFDTSSLINTQSAITILNTSRIEGPHGPFFRDISYDFDTIEVTKKGVLSKKNYKANSAWIFTKKSSSMGDNTATVSDTDF